MGAIDLNKCEQCGVPATLRCTKCRNDFFCTRDCQIMHWKKYKGCGPPKKLIQEVEIKKNNTNDILERLTTLLKKPPSKRSECESEEIIKCASPLIQEIEQLETKLYNQKEYDNRDKDLGRVQELKKKIDTIPVFEVTLLSGISRIFERTSSVLLHAKVAQWLDTISLCIILFGNDNKKNNYTLYDNLSKNPGKIDIKAIVQEVTWDGPQLLKAVIDHLHIGDVDLFKRMKGKVSNIQDVKDNVLFYSIDHGCHSDAFHNLLKSGASVNKLRQFDGPPLMIAVANEKIESRVQKHSITTLLEFKANPNWCRQKEADSRYSALHHASHRGLTHVVELLVASRADVNLATVSEGVTPLMYAIDNNKEETVRTLIRLNANIHAKDYSSGFAPIMYACETDNLPLTKVLVEARADVNICSIYGQTCLHLAQDGGNKPLTQYLKKCGATLGQFPDAPPGANTSFEDIAHMSPLDIMNLFQQQEQGLIFNRR